MYSKKPVVAELHGGQTDNNSFLFKSGYESILNPLYKNGTFKKGPQQFTPDWDNQKAGTIFEQMLARTQNKIDRSRGGQRRPRQRGDRGVEGTQAEADPAQRPGRDRAGCPEHHLRLADDDRLEGHAEARDGICAGGDRPLEGPEPRTTGTVDNNGNGCRRTSPAGADHEGELQVLFNGYLKRSKVCIGQYAKFCT